MVSLRATVIVILLGLAFCTSAFAQCAPTVDCNGNGVLDSCDLLFTSDDCNGNGIPDECDIASATEDDCNLNGIPDSCEPAPVDAPSPTGGFASASSVAIDGDFAVVGSTSGNTGAGTAHVFRRVGTIWVEDGPALIATDAASGDLFGASVAISGDLLAIGAPGADIGTDINSGAIYVFRRNVGGTWIAEDKFFYDTVGTDESGYELGTSVAARGDRILAGAPMTSIAGGATGRAEFYSFDGSVWSSDATAIAPSPVDGDHTGAAVDLGSDYAFIGIPGRTVTALVGAGEVHVYRLVTGTWTFTNVLSSGAPQAGAGFGSSVAGTNTTLAVGAPAQDASAGSVYTFERVGTLWAPSQTLTSPAGTPSERFGTAVGMSETLLVIGEGETAATTLGMAHVYLRGAVTWTFDSTHSEGVLGDQYGESVATDGIYAIVAAPGAPSTSVHWLATILDCNLNLIDDACDIAAGTVTDCNLNGIPDSCEGVTDTTNPVIAGLPANISVINDPGVCGASVSWTAPTASDDCQIDSFVTTHAPGTVFAVGSTSVVYIAVDTSGNLASESVLVTVTDTENPSWSGVPADITVNNGAGACSAAVSWTAPSVSDNCSIASFSSTHNPGTTFPVGTTLVTYSATDVNGNLGSVSFNVTVIDAEAPVIAGLVPVSVNSTGGTCDAVVTWTPPTTTDNCAIDTVTSDIASGSVFPVGVTTVTYTATDLAGNSSLATFDVTVVDTTLPTIIALPANITVNADALLCSATATWTAPTTTDDCGSATLSSSHAPGATFPVGVTTVTYTATDVAGNQATGTFDVTVNDLEIPTWTFVPATINAVADLGACGTNVTWTPPTPNDNCTVATTSSTQSPTDFFAVGTTTVIYTATDLSGNVGTATFDVIVTESELPVIAGVPADITVNSTIGLCGATATWIPPTATDNCAVLTLTGDATSGGLFPVGATTVTYTATDVNGNVATASFLVTVIDLTPPTLAGIPADITIPADAGLCTAVVTWTSPTGADDCVFAGLSSTHAPGSVFPIGATTVTYTASDAAGNETTGSFLVTVTDVVPPIISSVPADITVPNDAGVCGAIVSWAAPTATDLCGTTTVTADATSGGFFAAGVTLVTFTATDNSGNASTQSFTITVNDTEAPAIAGMPADISLSAAAGTCAQTATWTEPTATDNCAINTFGRTAPSGSSFPVGQTVVTYTATDLAGNLTSLSFTVTVTDDELPIISSVPGDIAISAVLGTCAATVSWIAPVASDNCSVASFTSNFAPGASLPVGDTTVTYTATDASGNLATASFLISVTDDELPTIASVPSPIIVNAAANLCAATVTWGAPIASDNCSVASLTPSVPSGSSFPVGTTTVVYTAIDASGNTATASFPVTVNDVTLPVIAGFPANIVITAEPGLCSAIVTWTAPTASDNCSITSFGADATSGASFPVGLTNVTYTAVDASGNSSVAILAIEVTDDELPTISGLPADIVITAAAGLCSAPVIWTEPTAADNCAIASLTTTATSGTSFPVGTATVTYTATDTAGNTASGSFNVTVTDDEAPVIAQMPTDITLSAPVGTCAQVATWTEPTATDNCALASLAPDVASGTSFPVGTTVVTYTATDVAGNSATETFLVTVTDDERPVIVGLPVDISVTAPIGTTSAIVTWTEPTATDNCTLASLTPNIPSGSSFSVGVTSVTYTAIDVAGNSITGTFTVSVTDNEAPEILGLPANIVVSADPGVCTVLVAWVEPTATDNSAITSFDSDIASGSVFTVGTTTVTYTAIDDNSNTTTASFTVTVNDLELPVISGAPADIALVAPAGTCAAIATWTAPTATDNCNLASLTPTAPSGSSFPVGVTSVTYAATDDSGNTLTQTFTVTVTDAEAPVLSAIPANINLSASLGTCAATATWATPIATDNCSIASLTSTATSGSSFPVGTTTITYTATDASGNIDLASFTVTVTDDQDPQIVSLPANISINADPGTCSTVVFWSEPTATDNCTLATFSANAVSGTSFPVGVTPVTYTATDVNGNFATSTFVVSVIDNENPTIAGLSGNIVTSVAPGTCAQIVLWSSPIVNDNCGIASVNSSHASGASFPVGVTPVNYVVTDTAGNVTTATFLVTVNDNEAPTISGVPADIFVSASAGLCNAVVAWVQPTASDLCGIASLTSNHASGSSFPVGTTTVTYTASDGSNVAIATFSVTVTDDQAPVISGLPVNFTVASIPGGCSATVSWATPAASDNCALASLTSDLVSGATFPVGSTTVTYTATDVAGNSSTASFSFLVSDDQLPTISAVPANVTVTTTGGICTALASWIAPTAADNCGVDTLTSTALPGDSFPVGVTTVTYTATDAEGNAASASFTITVLDGDPPTLTSVPVDVVVSNDAGVCGAQVTWAQPIATDACSTATAASDIPSGATFPIGTTTVTYTATDTSGNTDTASFTVTVNDTQAPTITALPLPITISAEAGTCQALATWTAPSGADNCALASLTADLASGSSFPVGVTAVTYTATDDAGNSTLATFTVTVTDNEAPTLAAVPSAITVFTAGGLCTQTATWIPPTPSDNCGSATTGSNFAPGSSFPVGVSTVTYTATDPAGNSSSASFTVTVIDGDAPVIVGTPANITAPNGLGQCGATVTWAAVTATDSCASASVTADFPSGSLFPVGTTLVTLTATDGVNSQTTTFTVTVNDTEAPAIASLPAPITASAAAGLCGASVPWTPPTAIDNCVLASLTSSHAPGAFFPVGTTTVTYTAADNAGNSTPATFDITVTDDEAPTFSTVPADVTVFTTGGLCTAAATWTTPTTTDNCTVDSLVGTHTSGALFPVGVTSVTYTATDLAGNSVDASFLVTVVDGDAPVIAGTPADVVISNDPGACSAIATWTEPTATDSCAVATLSSDFTSGATFPVGTTTVTYTATDGGNSSTATFTVTILDNELPTILGLPAPLTLSALPGSCAAPAVWVAPSAADNCAVLSLTSNFPSGSSFPVGVTAVTYTATDTAGNPFSASFDVTVTDNEDPAISGMPTDITQAAAAGVGSAIVTWTAPTAADNCALASLVSSHASGSSFPIGVTTVTYTATDDSGNTSSASFTVTVSDNESPVISGLPGNLTVSAAAGLCSALVNWTAPTASDNGALVSFTSTAAPGDSFPVGSTTVTYSATDDAANVTTASFTVTVTDDELPVFLTTPAAITLSAAPGTCANLVNWSLPTVSDNCGIASLTSNALPGASLPVGTTTVTYTVTDVNGNSDTTSFVITVTDDELPLITGIPANIVASTAGGLCTAGASWVAPAAFDNCGIATLSADATSGDAFSVGVNTVTFTATDVNGNVTTGSFTVTVVDGDAPVISGVPINLTTTADLGVCGATVTWAAPTATDACGVASLSSSHPNGSVFLVGTTVVTFTASDGANSSNASFSVTVTDNEDPTISGLPGNLVVPITTGLCSATVTWTAPIALDNCQIASFTSDSTSGSSFPVGTTPVIYVATDTAGNSTSGIFNVTVVDDQQPLIIGSPIDISLTTAGGLCTAVATWPAPSATDNCTLASLTSNFPPGSNFPVGVTTVTYSAVDLAGNVATADFTVTVNDGDAPVISSLPANISISALAGTCAAPATWATPVAVDSCGSGALSASHTSGSSFPVGTTTVTYTATDGLNNSTASFTVTVTDDEDPVIVGLPATLSVAAALGSCTASVTWTPPTVTDNCGTASLTPNIPPGTTLPLGNTPITYIATDPAGNTAFGTFIVTVTDAEPPTIAGVPTDITVAAAVGTCSRNVSWAAPTATDLCGGANLNASIPPGASFPAGTTTVVYTATDTAGNSAQASFTVTVVDENPPTLIGVPGNQVLTVNAGLCTATAIWSDPVAIDPCGGVTVTSDALSGTAFPIGTTVVTYTATDSSGNSTQSSFGVTVVDNTGPLATGVPANIFTSVAASSCDNIVTWTEPVFTDGCGIASLTQSHTPGQLFTLGTTTVIYTATDPSGNQTTVFFDVVVADTLGPAFANVPADIVVPNASGLCSATVNWTNPTASDPCGVASVSSNFSPGSVLAAGITTVTYTATDTNGNVSTASFTITIQDLVQPALINVPADSTIPSAAGFCGTVPIWIEPQPVDNCGILSITTDVPLGTFFPLGTTIITYTATDLNNNMVSASFSITVVDQDAPVFAGVPADSTLTLALGSCSQVVTWIEPTAADPCGLQSLTSDLAPGATLGAGTTVVTYTATDVNGNISTASFSITIVDPESPALAGVSGDISASADPGVCGAAISWPLPSASDNCGAAILTSDFAPGDTFPIGSTLVTYTATDESGNETSASFTVTVIDDVLPTIPNLPAEVTVTTSNNQCQAFASWPTPVPVDNCGVASITGSHTSPASFPVGATDVSYSVTDVNGNSNNFTFTVTVIDDDPPSISGLPVVLNVQSGAGLCGALVTWATPITSDNCTVVSLTSTHQPGDFFPIGTTVVTYTATDASGNTGNRTLTISVVDNQAPVISGAPTDISVPNDPGSCFAAVSWTPPTASDNCTLISFTSSLSPGNLFPIGITPVSYAAEDENGNTTFASFLVSVTDTELPSLTIGGDLNATPLPGECTAQVSVPLPAASDNCNLISVTNDFNDTGDASGSYPIGTTVVTWLAIDENGNLAIDSQTISVDIPSGADCNSNGIADVCDIALGTASDCNSNGIPDSCDIASGTEIDANQNGTIDSCEAIFVRGDNNNDGNINIADPIFLLQTLFTNGPAPSCLDAGDSNDDGFIDISDVIFEISYIFSAGAAPAAPFPTCGLDPTGTDTLDCNQYDNCL